MGVPLLIWAEVVVSGLWDQALGWALPGVCFRFSPPSSSAPPHIVLSIILGKKKYYIQYRKLQYKESRVNSGSLSEVYYASADEPP